MRPEPFVVRHVTSETGDTFTLTLGRRWPGGSAFAPGQFNMLYVFGVGEVPISISGDPAKPELLVHTIRAVGATTRAMQKLAQGRRGSGCAARSARPWPVDQAHGHDVVLVAGGIGLAPLRPALYHVLRHRALYGRVVLLYGARTPAGHALPEGAARVARPLRRGRRRSPWTAPPWSGRAPWAS